MTRIGAIATTGTLCEAIRIGCTAPRSQGTRWSRTAAAKPIATAHSIWELVLHIAAWKNEVRNRLSGAPAGEPLEGDWPPVGAPTAERWSAAREHLELAHRLLVSAVRDLHEPKLFEATHDARNRALGIGVTYYELLHGIVQHDVYHAGQIAILSKARR